MLVTHACTLVVLDIGLPDDDGFAIARHLRETTDAGIIMLTERNAICDHIRGLAEGADAYFSKPLDVDVLASALHSLSRRMSADTHATATPAVAAMPWRLEADGLRLLAPNGSVIALSLTGRAILKCLEAADRPVPMDALVAALAQVLDDVDPSRMEMLIHRLRRKVVTKAGQELPLAVVRRIGYLLSI